jgi:hypothetical protein
MSAMADLVSGKGCKDDRILYDLQDAGLIKRTGGHAEPRYDLYAKYFKDHLADGA